MGGRAWRPTRPRGAPRSNARGNNRPAQVPFGSRLRAAAGMAGDRFVCADRFTMADISFAYALKLATNLGITDLFPAKLVPYYEAMQARPGFKRAIAAEG